MTNFPIKTATGCRLKWAYSTIFLSRSATASCHRVKQDPLTLQDFENFHNLPRKLNDRALMKEGKWPGGGCEYCKRIEDTGGFSDRQMHLTEPFDDLTPVEMVDDPEAVSVTPRILEVYFNNTCNFKCLYCGPWFSSKIGAELKMHGPLNGIQYSKKFTEWEMNPKYDMMVEKLWEYLAQHHLDIRNFHILGGEPFLQKEFEDCLDFFEAHPSPNLNFVIVTNLSANDQRMDHFVDRFRSLLSKRKLCSIQITASLDCWGPQSEYIRNGLDLKQWERNFEKLLDIKWVRLQINHAITSLSIKYMPELLSKMQAWNEKKKIYSNFMTVQAPTYMNPDIFDGSVFDEDFAVIDGLMLGESDFNLNVQKYMQGIRRQVAEAPVNVKEIKILKTFLEDIDKRRNSDYTKLFPWLVEEFARYDSI